MCDDTLKIFIEHVGLRIELALGKGSSCSTGLAGERMHTHERYMRWWLMVGITVCIAQHGPEFGSNDPRTWAAASIE